MSQFKPYMITEAQKNNLPVKNGQLIFTTDKKNIYLDQENERLPFAFSAKEVLAAIPAP